jgi:hypothetical protein
MAKEKYKTLEPIEHNKKAIEIGSEISLDDEEAEPLLRVKAIVAIASEEAAAASAPSTKAKK